MQFENLMKHTVVFQTPFLWSFPPWARKEGTVWAHLWSGLTCDVGTLEAVTWQAVGGAVYMQNLAINSVKCLPEPQIRRQDCHHRLKSFKPENQKWRIAKRNYWIRASRWTSNTSLWWNMSGTDNLGVCPPRRAFQISRRRRNRDRWHMDALSV